MYAKKKTPVIDANVKKVANNCNYFNSIHNLKKKKIDREDGVVITDTRVFCFFLPSLQV